MNNTLAPGASARFALVAPGVSTGLPARFDAGLTVIRMIISVVIRTLTVTVGTFGAFGVFVNTAASAIDAIIDLYNYYLHQNWWNTNTVIRDYNQTYRREYDIRTARRVSGEQRSLDFAITNNAAAAASIEWSVNARLLLRGH